MPYFIFRISADKTMTLVNSCTKFGEAKELCRTYRQSQQAGTPDVIRMMFAATEHDARRLLSEKRQISSPLEEWEA
ncbi:MAG: hypothetical protein ACYDHM_10585 [Acidiferrobacterales bacterium]